MRPLPIVPRSADAVTSRGRELQLSAGGLSGPLLIPSISSKGFAVVDGLSEVGTALQIAGPDITEALLISAYDIHHGLLPEHEKLLGPEHAQTLFGTPALLVVDSGGYELSDVFESGEVGRGPRIAYPFGRTEYEALVDRLPSDRNLLVVTFDTPNAERAGYRQQRELAQQFAADRRHLKINFLLKPPAGDRFVEPAKVAPVADDLRSFDVVGVTEKELGDGVLDRMICLARMRRLLDDSGADNIPLHVFGGLDPVLTPLYFMAGAEIFDGLSWLRYAYHDDNALHPEELAALAGNIEASQVRRDAQRYLSNLQQLGRLKHALGRWASEPDRYEILGRHHARLREIYETFQARLGERM